MIQTHADRSIAGLDFLIFILFAFLQWLQTCRPMSMQSGYIISCANIAVIEGFTQQREVQERPAPYMRMTTCPPMKPSSTISTSYIHLLLITKTPTTSTSTSGMPIMTMNSMETENLDWNFEEFQSRRKIMLWSMSPHVTYGATSIILVQYSTIHFLLFFTPLWGVITSYAYI